MSFADQCMAIESTNRAIVMAQTFGHMEAQVDTEHKGWFTFINGQHGDQCVIESHFPTFDEGPGYFTDREEFIYEKTLTKAYGEVGVYRFEGSYIRNKHEGGKGLGRFVGKIRRIKI